jgi:hypothetical protein
MQYLRVCSGLERFGELLVSTEQVGRHPGAYAHFAIHADAATADTELCAWTHCVVVPRANARGFIVARTRETRVKATTCSGDTYDEKDDRASKCLTWGCTGSLIVCNRSATEAL